MTHILQDIPSTHREAGTRDGTGGTLDGFFAHHGFWAPGVRVFRKLGFRMKATLIALAFMLPAVAMLSWQQHEHSDDSMKARKSATREHVEIAHGVVAWAHAQEASGAMSREQAQETAVQQLRQLRYGAGEYFWINDMEPRMVMHAVKPELDGQVLGGMKDPNGLALFNEFVGVVRADGNGFVSYQWPKPGSDKPVDKLSYVAGFEPWGWVIGSGIYVDDLRDASNWRLVRMIASVIATLVLAGYLFHSFYMVMDGGLHETRRHLRAMSAGDLTTTPAPWGRDEAAELMLDLRAMQESLRTMVLRVRRSSDRIVHTSSEIASGAADLSARTEEAAANLEESAAAMEQISSTVQQGSDRVAEASQVARLNAELAATGGATMKDVVRNMEDISASSARIGEIIGTIDGIAFQTNILALNAAVEAARAGEQGRGFAVVASEVRTLASRSAEAAREIKTLITGSLAQIDQGSKIVRDAGSTIEEIVTSSRRVDHLLGEVAMAAREQSAGIGQIGGAIQELDRMTQQNAALVEQTAAASTEMKERATDLSVEVAHFVLPESDREGYVDDQVRVDDFDFDAAINAHRQWKVRLRHAIADRAHLDADTICRDDQCPLGRWIHGPGGARWGSRPLFGELKDKHAEFHEVAGEVARSINRDQYSEAERLIGSGSQFARISSEVATVLTRVKREM